MKDIIYKILKDQKVNLKNIDSKELLEYMKNNGYADWAYDKVRDYMEDVGIEVNFDGFVDDDTKKNSGDCGKITTADNYIIL